MNLKSETPLLPPLAAALAGWMLSGSPVPMALTLLLLPVALVGGSLPRRRAASAIRSLVPLLLAGAAAWLEIRLFLDGRALAMRAELPLAYHLGLAALWWTALDPSLRASRQGETLHPVHAYAGLVGGLLVLGASAGTALHDFGPWLVHPVAALPFALWAARLLLPAMPFTRLALAAVLPACLALAGLVLASSAATETLRPLLSPGTDDTDDAPAIRAPQADGSGTLGEGASRRLPGDGNVRFRHEIVVQVRPHSDTLFRVWSGNPLYLRTSTLALFENDEVLSPIRSGRWLYDQDDGTEDHRIPLRGAGPDDTTDPATLHTVYVGRHAADELPLVGGSQALLLASVYEFADDWYQLSPAEGIDRLRYTASAPPVPPAEIRPSDLIRPTRGTASGIYLQLPPSPLPSRIDLLCRHIGDDDLLGGIQRLLDERTRYSLQFQTPEGSSPLAEFLFGHGLGHCEHYAAATVLMLRCLGIPSRVAYGYAGGLVDADQGVFAFRDSDFHAWAEILTAENEWKIFDTTPHVPSAAPRLSIAASLPAIDAKTYHDLSDFDPAALAASGGAFLADAIDFLSRHFFLATAAGLALFGGLWWLLPGNQRERERRPPSGRRPETDAKPPLPGFLRELEQSAQALGLHRRPGHTWRELLARLSETNAVPAAAHDAVAYHYRTAYAGKERDPAEEARFREALRAWRETELH